MRDEHELPELSNELQSLLEEARQGDPRSEELASLRARFGPLFHGGGGQSGAGQTFRKKMLSIGAAGAAILVGLIAFVIGMRENESITAETETTTIAPTNEHHAVSPEVHREAHVETEVFNVSPAASPTSPEEPRPARHSRRIARDSPAVPTEEAQVTEPEIVRNEPIPDEADEAQLVERARRAARSEPSRALALIAEHAETFPHGALRTEAEVIRVQALLALGQREEARRRADALIESAHGGVYRHRLERMFAQ
jgi:hypothetical protein